MNIEAPKKYGLVQALKSVIKPDNMIIESSTSREYRWENLERKQVALIYVLSSAPALIMAGIAWLASYPTPDIYGKVMSPILAVSGLGLSRILYNAVKKDWRNRYQGDLTIKESQPRKSS
jgi:hypothetical protein